MSVATNSSDETLDYQAIFRNSPERIIIFKANHPDYTFVEVSNAHTKLTGVSRDKLVGRNFFELFPDTSEKFKKTGVNQLVEDFKKIVRTKKPIASKVFRYDIPDQVNGGFMERYWKTVHSPILNAAGTVTHIVQVSNDVTAEHVSEREVREIRDQLQDALEIGGVGSWVWDVDTDSVIADRNLAKMFGVAWKDASGGMPLSTFTDAIHPEDRTRVLADIQKAIRKQGTFESEYRIVSTSKKVRWVLARGKMEKRTGKLMFPGVLVDITERRNLQSQIELARQQDRLNQQVSQILQQRNEELEAVARTKDEFVALASHQLRTPATAVKQYLGMVLQGYVGEIDDLQRDMLGKAFEGNERQIQIINQILNAARVDTGRLMMTPVSVDLVAMVRGISDEMRAALEQRAHSLHVSLPEHAIWIMADPGYLRMAIENLVHNAGIYTPNGGTITISLAADDTQARLSVADTGVGIKKADIKKLFSKFSRIHNPLSVQAGGSGIGLYLTAEIVRLHGGTVAVDSKIRVGTTFAILLPLTQNTS